MEIVIVLGCAILGIFIGWNLRERFAIMQVQKMIEHFEYEEGEESSDVVNITIEQDKGFLFAYHKENSQFIAQGATRSELEKKLAEMFPGKKFGVTPENLKEIGFTL